jgi:GGDEF domain-containing protein
MESATVARPGKPLSARALELSSQLRAAVMEGDERRIARTLSDLLRVKGLTKGQRVSLQLRAVLGLVHTLRSSALSDEVTGLHNRRGFVQTATRLLDLAGRDGQPAHLVYFCIGEASENVLVRQMGNFLRDLFPGYGVYDVLGRLSGNEFAALTTNAEYAARSKIVLRARQSYRDADVPASALRIGVAHFNPARPVAIDELLQSAAQAATARPAQQASPARPAQGAAMRPAQAANGHTVTVTGVTGMASPGITPQAGLTLC